MDSSKRSTHENPYLKGNGVKDEEAECEKMQREAMDLWNNEP